LADIIKAVMRRNIMFKILIAEDDRKLCQLFERVLIKNGYYTKGVANGKEALDAMDKEYFDLLITDIMMPIMDGYELIDSIREAGNNMPVLMITAKNEFDDLKMGFMSGTDDFMVKPININEMVLRVAALLRRAQMINDRRQTIGGTLLECDSLTITTNGESIWLHVKKIRQEELRDVNMRKKTKSCVKRKVPTFKQ